MVERTVKTTDKIEGKTIKKAYLPVCGGDMILRFDDDTFMIISAEHDYDQEPEICWHDNDTISRGDLVHIGLLTKEEFETEQHEEVVERHRDNKIRERELYESLKLKYEHKE